MRNKSNPGTEVSRSALNTAFLNWVDYYEHTHNPDALFQKFANYLGVSKLTQIKNTKPGILMMRKSAVDKIMLLNSPHWYTLMKAKEARKQ